ncbi:hypothetical protein UB43_28705, partial [Pseudomonas sp. 21]
RTPNDETIVQLIHFFLRANRIKSCACVSHERTARFDPNFRNVKTVTGSIFFHSFDNFFNVFSGMKRFIIFRITNAETSSKIQHLGYK